jgi:hypothetical protein
MTLRFQFCPQPGDVAGDATGNDGRRSIAATRVPRSP